MKTINVITSNIRFNNPNDGVNAWDNRKEILASTLMGEDPDVICTQEGWQSQLYELNSLLDEYVIIDRHRKWIKDRMYPTIFFKASRFEVLVSRDIWLSETPDTPATKIEGSNFPRLSTFVTLKDIKTKDELTLVNVHLDNSNEEVRERQLKILFNKLINLNINFDKLILAGDFNAIPGKEVYQLAVSELADPWLTFGKDEEASFHNFKGSNPDGYRIDWILHSKAIKCTGIQIIKSNLDGRYPSDHFPIKAVFNL